ncbi:hypothetical protein EXIGLDRAFT_252854 [Exidia glandulosa HHB12029]|uniref:Uncharacterized protein n=1 Tax=Exidia glandulosa HHB12029 TaxID=1314781 RepID=A0A165MIQ7_EXIGL|nr:hypothetical protein EXIGLDRAFT_252854 [Exidia glandulosa HHB12029]
MAASCPPELLLAIFDYLEPLIDVWDPLFFSADVLAARRRSTWSTVAACARVCKAWSLIAQHVLYREVSLSSAARRRPPYWHADTANRGVIAALTGNPALATYVETLQTGVGEDCDRPTAYGNLQTLVKTLRLCRNLVHLDLTIGCNTRADQRKFTEDQLAALAQLHNVRHLSVHDSAHTFEPPAEWCNSDKPSLEPVYQLLSVWPNVEVLSLNIARAQFTGRWTYGTLPRLREIRCSEHNLSCKAAIPVLARAPNLQHIVLAKPACGILMYTPAMLKYLTLYGLGDPTLNLSHLVQLERFSLIEGRHPGMRDHRGSLKMWTVSDVLQQLSPSVPALALPAELIEDTMDRELLFHALLRLTGLKTVTFESGCRYLPPGTRAPRAVMEDNAERMRGLLRTSPAHSVQVLVREVFKRWDDVPRMRHPEDLPV